ncbi:MAG: PilZ domain-containing protein [Mariprofundaceae bacterium]|nr:PilZ domain-containing protein [Mariprofundaceae bacterium]
MDEFSGRQERRQHERKEASFQIEIQHINDGRFEQVELIDISDGGMRFKVSDIAEYCLKQELRVSVPQFVASGEVTMQHMRATVLWLYKADAANTCASVGVSLRQL